MTTKIIKTTLPLAALLAFASASLAADTYTVTEGGLTTTYDAVSYYSKPLAYSTTRDPDPPKELQSHHELVCRLLLEKKNTQ